MAGVGEGAIHVTINGLCEPSIRQTNFLILLIEEQACPLHVSTNWSDRY